MEHFERNDSGGMFFCFRWILILFKREFCVEDLWNIWLVCVCVCVCVYVCVCA
jgi:hypothetical protein